MANIPLVTTISLDGEKAYRDAISKINSDMRVTRSEMRLVTDAFKGQEDSTEALAEKKAKLTEMIAIQTEKIGTYQGALENAKSATNRNEKAIADWTVKTNDAKRDLIKMQENLEDVEAQLAKTTDATEDFGDAQANAGGNSKGLGSILDELGGKFGISLPNEMKSTLDGFGAVDTKLLGSIGIFAGAAAAIFEVEKALAKMTIESAKYADEILTTSTVTGISTKALQEYTYAAELLDVSVDTITGSQTKMINTMDAARAGNKEAADAFKQLGVRIMDSRGQLRDAETVFAEAIDALGEIENATERDALAMDIFGKSARDLNPLIQAGSEGLAGFAQEAHDVGYVLDEEALASLGAVDDAMQRFDRATEAAKNNLSVQFAPALANIMDVGTDLFQTIGEAAEESGIVSVFAAIMDIVAALEPLFDVFFGTVGESTGSVLKPLAVALGVVADALNIIASLIAIIIEGLKWLLSFGQYDEAGANISKYWGNITGVFEGDGATARALESTELGRNARGTDYWGGGYTWVGEEGPEIVELPRGSRIYSNAESKTMGGDVFNITIDAKNVQEFNEIVQIARRQRLTARAGTARG